MNSKQLRWILSNDKVTSRNFKDVYALDEIKHIQQISLSSAYVFNLEPSYKPRVNTHLQLFKQGCPFGNAGILGGPVSKKNLKNYIC